MNCAIHSQVPAVAYCRTCGKALCEECKRGVQGAIYCEPCIAARMQGVTPVPAGVAFAQPAVPGAPNPTVAALLGMIPGVGAMYNGQFAKAFIHVVIFGCLIAFQDHVHFAGALFGLLTTFFWFYMVIEAYKTAKARQMGLPPPDLLGIDRIFGIQEAAPPTAPIASATPVGSSTGSDSPPVTPVVVPPVRGEQGPTGAIILIGLGVFFLLGNFGMLQIDRMWPVLLIALGAWIAIRRTAHASPRSNG
jgi:TM2 domain-containing membrane protein YozV